MEQSGITAREVLEKLYQSLKKRYNFQEVNVTAVQEVVTVYHGSIGFMIYSKVAFFKVNDVEWAVSIGSRDGTDLTKNYDSDLVIVKVHNHKDKLDYVTRSIEQGRYFINSLLYCLRTGEFHFNRDGISKKYYSILDTKLKEYKFGKYPNLKYNKQVVEALYDITVSIFQQ